MDFGRVPTIILGLVLLTLTFKAGALLQDMNEWNNPQPEILFNSMYKNDAGQLSLNMENKGTPANFTQFEVKYNINGQVYNQSELKEAQPDLAANNTCFTQNGTWGKNTRYSCQTGINFPQAQTNTMIIISFKEGEIKWKKGCKPVTTDAIGC
ncbi:hypothetical protein [Candidatus Nanohalovita haloferacivicina]|uniref:hypothetical protein n=1 Tax=Candidatus Nanohalovita haloferacivicina TaxID=2978046 RepID=UPI00325F9E20|nr:hypothetical protein HBNXNv_0987 [Candidatus Nanohalobia archaeon BNXNv]